MNDDLDTVSRQYLLAEIDDLADEFSEVDENGLHSERWCGIMDAKLIIMNAPFVSDRPQGEWIDFKNGWKCTACEKWNSEKSNFCPNCGADMRNKDDEQ